MKNIFFLILTCAFLVSCGKEKTSSSSESNSEESPQQTLALSPQEKELVNNLLNKQSMDQKEFFYEIINFSSLSSQTIEKLDQLININCTQESGLCYFSTKE
jgi:hypothetical protein